MTTTMMMMMMMSNLSGRLLSSAMTAATMMLVFLLLPLPRRASRQLGRRWRPGLLASMALALALVAAQFAPGLSVAAAAPADSRERPAALTADDQNQLRRVIQGQLDAFARGDAAKAFSFAAPNVRDAFVTAPRFMDMVQRGYPVVINPAGVAFLKPEGTPMQALQKVQITDQAGDVWLATYSLARQKSRSWRITGCSITENKGRMA